MRVCFCFAPAHLIDLKHSASTTGTGRANGSTAVDLFDRCFLFNGFLHLLRVRSGCFLGPPHSMLHAKCRESNSVAHMCYMWFTTTVYVARVCHTCATSPAYVRHMCGTRAARQPAYVARVCLSKVQPITWHTCATHVPHAYRNDAPYHVIVAHVSTCVPPLTRMSHMNETTMKKNT